MPYHTIYYCHACGSRTVPHNELCAFCDSEFIEIYDSVEYYRSVHFGIGEILRSIAIGQVDVNELDWLISDISDRIRRLTRDLLNIRSSRGRRARRNTHAWRALEGAVDAAQRYNERAHASDHGMHDDARMRASIAHAYGHPANDISDYVYGSTLSTADDINNYAFDHELEHIIDEIFMSTKVSTSPVSNKYIKALQVSHARQKGKCMICLSTYRKGECGIELSCAHFFHKSCGVKWMKMQNTCPICRHEIEK
ncbi:putative E3 ubiquitin ligase [Trachipleistophora hominis]|uniref:RING-type E3 ubiquitin transferase n=1 Tax=Trachipleistophora hominis TaxID=72359 RepID=L7JWX9_TRAHO|nr:putative E3 ubiquitin ligase [Trachipleistophora hominis]